MLGAIIGDIIGSRFEFNNIKTTKFDLLTDESTFTDDTVLTVAVMDWVLHSKKKDEESIQKYLRRWAEKYPFAGYGGRFVDWLISENPKPYSSWGNGAAMRISPIGWITNDWLEAKKLSDIVTGVTHNHPDGIVAAFVTVALIMMGRDFKSKEEMRVFASHYYNLNLDYEDLVKNYKFTEKAADTVPQAIYCFLISSSFEDCIRKTVSIGGDSDTLCAISGAIAEAYYHVGENNSFYELKVEELLEKLPEDMLVVIKEFKKEYGGI